MHVDVTQYERQNVVRASDGLRTRKAFARLATPTVGTNYIGGFTIESPFTSEPWHYLFEQSTSTNDVTVRVVTEEFVEVFSWYLGRLAQKCPVSFGVVNNQVMISSPAFSSPLYGLVGGGLITATKTDSINPDTTALDIPAGHLCAFGDRIAIAQGNVVFFNDPATLQSVDPRTFVVENTLPLPGTVYDLFQGPDGALYMFTSDGVYTLPADALGQGQTLQGFLGRVPGIFTSKPRNACATTNGIVILQRDHVLVLRGGAQQRIPLAGLDMTRTISTPVDVEDARLFGEVYPTSNGFVVAFKDRRSFYLVVDLVLDSVSYWYAAGDTSAVVGTLRTRDGETLHLWSSGVIAPVISGTRDHTGSAVVAYLTGRVPVQDGDNPIVRRVTTQQDNVGVTLGVAAACNGARGSTTTPKSTSDIVIGTSAWSATATFSPRPRRSARSTLNKRSVDPLLEVAITGGDVRIGAEADVELGGIWRTRPGAWQ
jgi:hypothetical protein